MKLYGATYQKIKWENCTLCWPADIAEMARFDFVPPHPTQSDKIKFVGRRQHDGPSLLGLLRTEVEFKGFVMYLTFQAFVWDKANTPHPFIRSIMKSDSTRQSRNHSWSRDRSPHLFESWMLGVSQEPWSGLQGSGSAEPSYPIWLVQLVSPLGPLATS